MKLMDPNIPLIWTSRGNIPLSDVKQITRWLNTPVSIQLVIEYYVGEELVKCDCHVYSKE